MSYPMQNICFLNTTAFWGGGEKLHLEYALRFRNLGYTVFIACREGSPLDQQSAVAGIPRFHITLMTASFLNPYKIAQLKHFLASNHIDTLIFSGSSDFKSGSIAAQLARVARIVYLRGLAVPIRNTLVNRHLMKNILTHIIANSEETKKTMLMHLAHHIPAEKVTVVYHGIDLADYSKRAVLSTEETDSSGVITIGNAGRLTLQKGQHLLIKVAELLKKRGLLFQVVIAGAGELEQDLRQQIRDAGLDDFVFLQGFVIDMPKFMQSIDVFVLTSKWEGFGYVIVEAMAAEKPVVAFNITSNPEIIAHAETGFLVAYPDIIGMADKLELLIRQQLLALSMGQAGRKRVEKMFVLDERIKELETLLLST